MSDTAYQVEWEHVRGMHFTTTLLPLDAALTKFLKKDADPMVESVSLVANKGVGS